MVVLWVPWNVTRPVTRVHSGRYTVTVPFTNGSRMAVDGVQVVLGCTNGVGVLEAGGGSPQSCSHAWVTATPPYGVIKASDTVYILFQEPFANRS